MKFDLSALVPLAESLGRAAAPTLAKIAAGLVPPPFDLLAGPVIGLIAGQFGVDVNAPDAPGQIAARIDADPTSAAAKLQPMESAHKEALDAAQAELDARLKDVQDARATEVAFVKADSALQWGAVAVSIIALGGFAVASAIILTGHNVENQSGQMIVGALLSGYGTVLAYWLGSSKGSRDKDATIAAMAGPAPSRTAPSPILPVKKAR